MEAERATVPTDRPHDTHLGSTAATPHSGIGSPRFTFVPSQIASSVAAS
jgi:hypothetical protein